MNENNKFKNFNELAWKIIEHATGAYELKAIKNEIQRQMAAKGQNGPDNFF